MNKKYIEEERVNKLLECQRCKQRYEIALMLPCGKSVCNCCVREEFGCDYGKKVKPNSSFKCLMCEKEHKMPDEGLPVNEHISEMLKLIGQEICLGELSKQLVKSLEKLEEEYLSLENVIANKKDIIRDHYESIRQEVDFYAQSRIDELNKAWSHLVKDIDEQERKHLNYLISEIDTKNDKMAVELINFNEKLDELREECERVLMPTTESKDSQLSDLLKQTNDLTISLSNQRLEFTNSLNVCGKKLRFVESKQCIDKTSIGYLKLLRPEYIDLDAFKLERDLIGHTGDINSLVVLADGTLVSASDDNSIKMWNTSTGTCIRTLNGHNDLVISLVLLSDGTLASSSYDSTIKLWNTSSGVCIRTLYEHRNHVIGLAVLPDGKLASASVDKTIKIWNTSSGACVGTLIGHTAAVRELAVLSNGTLVSISCDRTIKMWKVSTGECVKTLTGHSARLFALTVLSDDTIVSGACDNSIKIWNTSTGACILTLTGHNQSVYSLAVLSDGTLVSGSKDDTIKMWNRTNGKCLRTLSGHTSFVRALAILPDGTLVSGSGDYTIKIWNTK